MRLFHRHRWIYNHRELELATRRECACSKVERPSLLRLLDIQWRLWQLACEAAAVDGIIGKEGR